MGNPITQPIIFQLGSVGDAKFKAGVLAAAAAVAFLGKKMNDIRKSGEEWSRSWRQMTPEVRAFTIALDSAGEGLIDTTKAAQLAHKAFESMGNKATPELAKAIGMLATDMGTKLGESYDKIQARVEKLTKSISTGASKALKEYGYEVEKEGTLQEMQAEAIQKTIDRAKDLTGVYKDLGYEMDALANNKDTFLNLWYEWASRSEALGGSVAYINDTLADSNKIIMETDGAILDVIDSTEGFQTILNATMWEMMGFTRAARDQKIALHNLTQQQMKLNKAKGIGPKASKAAAEVQYPTLSPTDPSLFTKKKKTGGGGGGGKQAPPAYDPSVADIQQNLGLQGVGGDIGTTEAPIITGEEYDHAATMAAYEVKAELRAMEIEAFYAHEAERAEIYQVSQMETMLGIDQAYVDASYDLWESSIRGKAMLLERFFATGSQLMNAYNAESESANRGIFAYAKGMAIAQTIMKTYESAVSAYASAAAIPYAGFVLAPIAAVNALAFGFAQVREIAATKFDGSGKSAAKSIGGAGGSAGGFSGATGGGGGGGWQGGGPAININLGGDLGGLVDKVDVQYSQNINSGKWPAGKWGKKAA
jgi:hypothetical protein